MAHRGPLRELFGLLCMVVLFPKSEKKATPASNTTGYIIDHDDGFVFHAHPVASTPPTPGFLPLLLAFLGAFLLDIAETLVNMAFDWVLGHGFSPILSVSERAFSRAVTFVTRLLQASDPLQAESQAEGPGSENQGSDAEGPQPAPEDLPDNTSTFESNAQALIDLQADLINKDAQIAALIKTAQENSERIAALGQENVKTTRRLRTALDPDGRDSTTDLIDIANGLNHVLRSRNRKLEHHSKKLRKINKEKEEAALETAANLMANLEAEVTRLQEPMRPIDAPQLINAQTVTLDKEARDEEEKEAAKRLEDAEKKAEAEAMRAAELEGNLEKARKAAEALRVKAKRVEAAEKKAEAEATRAAELEGNLTTARDEAKEEATRVLELTQDLTAARGEAEQLRNTAGRVGTVESTAAELQHNLREAREEANEERRSNNRLIAKLVKTEEDLKKKEGEVTGIRRLESELEKAREEAEEAFQSGFAAAMSQTSQAPQSHQSEVGTDPEQQHGSVHPQDDVVRQNKLREEGYTMGVSDFREAGRREISQAIEKERAEAADRQRAAVVQKEQELQALFQQRWNEQLRQGTTADTQVQNATPEMVRNLEGQLQAAVQRAIRAEQQLNNPENPIQEARNWAIALKAAGEQQYLRAEAAEQQKKEAEAQARTLKEEIEKCRSGKLSLDGRLADAQRQLREAKKHRLSDIKIAELAAAVHERDRAWALMEEALNRHYESSTRVVVENLVNANSHIKALEIKLQISTTKSSQNDFLKELHEADVDEAKLKELTKALRQVLVRQCAAVNAKLMALRTLIEKDKEPDKEKLLLEIFKPRGDEEAKWDDEKTEFDAESVESDADEDEDKDGGSGRASSPSLPADPRRENHLKRKGSDDIELSRFGKPYDPMNFGMRPVESTAFSFSAPQSTTFSFNAPSNIASVAVNPTPAPPNHDRIFTGLPRVAANMAGNASALPGLPPPEDPVLGFESSAVTEEADENFELSDATPALNFISNMQIIGRDAGVGGSDGEYQSHTIGDDEEEEGTVWEDGLNRNDRDADSDFDSYFDFDLYTHTSTGDGDDTEPSTVRALDMTEQNYEEQEAEAAAAMHGVEQAPPKKDGQPQAEELEDNFHVDLD